MVILAQFLLQQLLEVLSRERQNLSDHLMKNHSQAPHSYHRPRKTFGAA